MELSILTLKTSIMTAIGNTFLFAVKNLHMGFLALYSIMTLLKYNVFENIMGNVALAHLEQTLHFP